jgi:hypothetical protein
LHEGLCFSSAGVEDVEVVDLESEIRYDGPPLLLEDGCDCYGWVGVIALESLGAQTHGSSFQ